MANKRRISMYIGRNQTIGPHSSGATTPEFNLPGRWKLIRAADVSILTSDISSSIVYPGYRNAIWIGVSRYIHCLYTDVDIPYLAIDDRTNLELDGVYIRQGDSITLATYNTLSTNISGYFAAVLTFEEAEEEN